MYDKYNNIMMGMQFILNFKKGCYHNTCNFCFAFLLIERYFLFIQSFVLWQLVKPHLFNQMIGLLLRSYQCYSLCMLIRYQEKKKDN